MSYGLRGGDGRLHGLGLIDGLSGVVNPPPPFNNCQPLGATYDGQGRVLSGTPISTQCMSYDAYAANTQGAVTALQSLSDFGVSAIRIYDPTGQKPEIQIMPGEDIVSALKAAGMPLQTPDQGFSYEYSRLFSAVMTPQSDPTKVRAQVAAQMLAMGFSQQALNDYYAGTPYETGTPDALTPYNDPAIAGNKAGSAPSGAYTAFPNAGSTANPAPPASSGGPTYSPAAYSPPATDPVLASALAAPSGILTQTPSASSPGTQTAAVVATPAVSNNALLLGGLAVVGILIMMSTGGKS